MHYLESSHKEISSTLRSFFEANKIKCVQDKDEISDHFLTYIDDRLCLESIKNSQQKPICIDFESKTNLLRLSKDIRHTELLYKAIKLKQDYECAIDGTAGMGMDSLIMAKLFRQVISYEVDPVIYLLLEDGLNRAIASEHQFLKDIASKVNLNFGSSFSNEKSSQLIYFDFMFLQQEKKAKSKKAMDTFKQMLTPVQVDEQKALLGHYNCSQHQKLVLKRPKKSEVILLKSHFSHSVVGKSVRFDIYLPNV